jgi:hypothetical protein
METGLCTLELELKSITSSSSFAEVLGSAAAASAASADSGISVALTAKHEGCEIPSSGSGASCWGQLAPAHLHKR